MHGFFVAQFKRIVSQVDRSGELRVDRSTGLNGRSTFMFWCQPSRCNSAVVDRVDFTHIDLAHA